MKTGESKAGIDYRIVNKNMCSLQGQHPLPRVLLWHFKDVLTWIHNNNNDRAGFQTVTKECVGQD